jgi:hypothetical protein
MVIGQNSHRQMVHLLVVSVKQNTLGNLIAGFAMVYNFLNFQISFLKRLFNSNNPIYLFRVACTN